MAPKMRRASSFGSSAATTTLRAAPPKPTEPEIRSSGSAPVPLFVWIADHCRTRRFGEVAQWGQDAPDVMVAVRVHTVADERDQRV